MTDPGWESTSGDLTADFKHCVPRSSSFLVP